MARTVFLAGGGAWLVLGVIGLAVAVLGREPVLEALPPLAIDSEALGGALTAIALAVLVLAAVHLAIAAGLGADRRWARSAGILLALTLALAFLGASAAAAASALRETTLALQLAVSALVTGMAVVGYAVTAVTLIREIGAGPGI